MRRARRNELTRLIFVSLFASLICVCTALFEIPAPLFGYVHLGDAMVLLCAYPLGPLYGAAASAIGSLFADLFVGYAIYAPATFLIKGLCAFFAYHSARLLLRMTKKRASLAYLLGGGMAELFMALAYYLYEATVCGFGFLPALYGIPANLMQGMFGVSVSLLLLLLLKKTGICRQFLEPRGFPTI